MSKKIKVSKVGQSDVYVPAYDSDGKTLTVESVVGPGAVPLGGMVVVMPHVDAAAWQPPASGSIKDGFMRADGTVITSTHVSQGCKFSAGATLPSMMAKYPRGNTTSGTTGGANTVTIASTNLPVHTHGFGTIAAANESSHTHGVGTYVNAAEAAHTHGVGTYANAAEAAHTHGVGTYGNTAEAAHTHSWGSYWSIDDATLYNSGDNGNGTGNTYSDNIAGITYWGSGSYAERATGTASADHSHGSGTLDVYCAGWQVRQGNGGSAGAFWDFSINAPPYNNSGDRDFTVGGDTGGMSANHTHQYYLPSHRHWIKGRATTAGSSHNHPFSGTSAAGASHNHVISGSSAAGASHNHVISGSSAAGASHTHTISGSTDNGGFANTALNNEPAYIEVIWVIRVK